MSAQPYGVILSGDEERIRGSYDKWVSLPLDQELTEAEGGESQYEGRQTTLAKPFSITGPGTFLGKAQRTLRFEPCAEEGWWFDRLDLPDSLPIGVSVKNIWTTARNVVLRSGSPHNYMRMVEHIIALKAGMGLDNVMIRMDSGDPPLFDRSSMDLVESVEQAGTVRGDEPALYVSV